MKKSAKKSKNLLIKIIELIGKPAFLLFRLVVTSFVEYLRLLKDFVRYISLLRTRISKKTLLASKSWKKRLSIKKPINDKLSERLALLIVVTVIIATTALPFYYYILRDLPSVSSLSDNLPSLSTKIFDRNGELLYQIYKDENRSLISLKNLPKYTIDATLSAEDKNFYHHIGIDPIGISRATINNLRCKLFQSTQNGNAPCSVQGGSTITQQLVKNALLSSEKTFTRKIKELILAFETEYTYSKDQILEMYLNQVGYGGTAYGIEEAAHQYFGKSAQYLTLSESTMLAGLPIAPTILSPFGTSPYLGKIRQQQVLESMVQAGKISKEEKIEALSIPLLFDPRGITIKAPHFVMYVKDILVKQYGEDVVSRGGLEVITTLDLRQQDILQTEINDELAILKKLHVQNAAGLIISPKSGEILAMIGSHDFFDTEHDGQVNVIMQPRQPGSSIKPITYALALSNGSTPNSIIDDTPICFMINGQPNYCPKNYDGRFHGKVTLRTALGSSYNIPAIKLLNQYGINNMVSLARELGIKTWEDSSRFGLSLTLGGGEITMIDLASVYSVFANGGTKVPFNPIISVRDSRGISIKPELEHVRTEVISSAVAYQINSILSDPLARAPAFGLNSVLNLPGKNVAVKTGTTNNLRDNWTFGYTEDVLVATWVGNNDNSPMSSVASGITGASPIWARTMKEIIGQDSPPPFTIPDTISVVNISCNNTSKYEYFTHGKEFFVDCSRQRGSLLPAADSTSQ